MNKKMLTLLAFLVAITSIFAVYVEIGDGTTTTNYVPLYGLYDYSWSNYILTSAQIGNEIDINELQFNVGNTPANYFTENQQVYMKLTTDTEVTVAYPDPTNNGFTLVFDGSITWNEGGWQGIILDTEFSYDGTSNLQIVWENNDGTYVGGYPNFLKTDSGLNTAAYKYTDNTFPIVDGTLQTYYPNTRLGFAAEGAPAYPVAVSPANNSINNELDTDLVWTIGDNTEFINVYFSTVEDDVVNNVETALVVDGDLVTTYSPTLENASVYYWKVVASNTTSEITASTSVFSFSTIYGIAEVPYSQGFEDVTTPALPLGWASFRESTTNYSYVDTYSGASNAYEGVNSLRMGNSSDITGTYIAIMPQIENMGNRLRFFAKCSSAGSQLIVGYLADVADATTFTEIQTVDMTSAFEEHTVELELPRTVRYIAFKHANVATYQTIYIDNIVIEEIPENEPTPATLLMPENGATDVAMDADLTWEYGLNTVSVNLYLSDDMMEVADLATEAMVIDNQDVTSYTADLDVWTTYYWRVGSLNSANYEVLSDIFSFTTSTPEGTFQIGEGTETNQGMPMEPYYGYTYTQTIYPQTDINSAGDIQTIAWHYNGNSAWGPDDIKIYMAHTTLTSYETTESWIALDDLTLVYDGTLSVTAVDGWVPITLDTPFNYNNTDNLVIAFEENTEGYHSSTDEFFNTVAEGNASITFRSDSINPDPATPPVGTLKAFYPNVVLVMDAGNPPIDEFPAPTGLVAEIQNENDIHLDWDAPTFPVEEGEWLWQGSGVYDDGFGTGGAFAYTGVVRYDAADLANFGGADLTQIKFYPRNAAATYALKVWTGGSYEGTTFVPGTEVVSLAISGIETFAWNTVELDAGITLAATEELWVGIEVTTPNGYPLGVDAGPAVVGKGDLIFFNGGWNLISNLGNDKNFLIQAYVEGGRVIDRDAEDFTAYNVYRNNSIIQSIADITVTEWVNTDVPNGVWEYKITALYGTESSDPSNVVIVDTTPPVYNPPTNFTAVVVNEMDVQINWDAPNARVRTLSREESLFGVESDNEITRDLTGYTVYRNDEILAEVGTTVMSYLDEGLDYGTYEYYAIANYDVADSDPTPVVTIVLEEEEEILAPLNLTSTVNEADVTLNWLAPGTEMPETMTEGFENGFPPTGWTTVVNNTTESWAQYEEIVFTSGNVTPTEGMYQAGVMWDYDAQDEWLITGTMTGITGLTFDFYGHYGSTNGDNYYVKVSTDGGANWTAVWNATDLPAADNNYETPIVIDLTAYAAETINIAWNFVDGDGAGLWYATYIDNIMFETSIATRTINANELVAYSKAIKTPVVRNNRDLTAYTIYRDDVEIATVAANVLAYVDADLENGDYEYYVTAMYGDVESEASNTVSATVNVTIPGDYLIEDSFETYTDFALEAGPWAMVDGDLSGTYSITNTTWENAEAPQAYIVFNPSMTTPPLSGDYDAYDGDKYMVAFASTVPANNDWMMTQEFTLGATGTFNFWAKSITDQYGLERFKVLVSNGSTNPNDFTSISGVTYTEAPTTWTQYSYSLDAYADQTVRVAIQCMSNDAFMFMVDQVQIEAPGGTDIPTNDIAAVSQLIGNYPNPFNPVTRIAFSTKENGPVSIDIYNIKGQKVKSLLNENREAGAHNVTWNGTDDNGKSVASGVFFYRMKSGKFSSTKKMILMK